MKYKKPQNAMYMLDLVVEGGGVLNWVRDVKAFLHSLPAEFEIVQPGMTQVRWPDGVTRSELDGWCDDLTRYVPENADILRYLRQLAAIAPVEKKKRKVWLWEKDHPHYTERSWTSNDIDRSGGGWRKVGECEVDA